MHAGACVCAPDAENSTRHGSSRDAASASGIRTPSESASPTLIGTLCRVLNWEPGAGGKRPRIRYCTVKCAVTSVALPASSAAVQRTVPSPTDDVETAPQLCDCTPVPASVALGVAEADTPRYVGVGSIVGASVGPVV